MVVERAFEEANAPPQGLNYEAFKEAMEGSNFQMQIDVPTD